MRVTHNGALRSLTSEAGRQTEYYARRGLTDLAEVWSELEALAFAASRQHQALIIEIREKEVLPIPNKACEKDQQPPKHNVIKAFQ